MEATKFTKITAEVSDMEKVTFEIPTQDVTIEDMCQAFRTIMVGMTFTDETAGEIIASYLEEYYGDLYNVVTING
jgi:hypothetical protein